MKKVVLFIMVLAIPGFIFLNLWQVFSYRQVESQISEMESLQKEYIEENKLMLANIAIAQSPERIESIAVDELGLKKIDPLRIMRIKRKGE